MRIAFMGTSEFAAPSLTSLIHSTHSIAGVWTRKDKPRGRGHQLEPSPVKRIAEAAGLPIFQPATLKHAEAVEEVRDAAPEGICVASYGLILPQAVLDIPASGCFNVHGSLLPRYRGAAPIHRAIIAGESMTGITTMMMNAGLDTGDILLMAEEPISPADTYGEVHGRLAQIGANLLLETLALVEKGVCPRTPQDEAQATYAPPVQKAECRVDWKASAEEVHNLVRGTNPRPGAFTFRAGDMLRLHHTRVVSEPAAGSPGRLMVIGKAPVVCCGQGMVELLSVQPAGKKPMSGRDYLLGHPVRADECLD